jgi:signal transduction histidine kinase
MKKLYIWLLGSALFSIILLGWLIDAFSQRTHKPQDEFSVQSKIIAGFSHHLAHIPTPQRSDYIAQMAKDFSLQLTYKPNESLALPPSLLLQIHSSEGLILEDQKGFYILYSDAILNPYHLAMRLEKRAVNESDNDIVLTLLFYSGLCVFMGLIIAPLARRLTELNEAAKNFASGNTQARIKVSHFTYIKDVELTFNKMASQIEKLVAENKLMASSLSHDIRTPIACLRFGLDAALDSDDEQKVKQYLTRMENDLDQMESMLKSYLAFATLEQNANKLTYSSTNISHYLEQILLQLAPKISALNLNVQLHSQSITICADLHWLARAITNLLTNACDFAQHDIYLSSEVRNQYLIITVEDDGPGIAHENFNKVFSPFFKEENHRNRADKSYGLGLAIVARVAEWHHGSVSVSKSKVLEGACFTLKVAMHTSTNLTI